MKSFLYPAEVLKGQQLGKRMVQVIEYHMLFHQHLRNGRFKHLIHKQLDHLILSFTMVPRNSNDLRFSFTRSYKVTLLRILT